MRSKPDAPGPPGLTNNEPILAPFEAWRVRASSMSSPSLGSSQFIGAMAVVHIWSLPQSDHSRTCS